MTYLRLHSDNAVLFGSARFKYFFDLQVGPSVIEKYVGEGSPDNIDLIHPDLNEFCEQLTGQPKWNDFKPYRRWGYLSVALMPEQDRLFALPYIASHLRFAFVRKRDAMMFKLKWSGV